MDGILVVDKPQRWTSFDVCAKLRNLTNTKKVGHSGTLDPMATGVLPVFFGKATKLIQGFMADDKVYVGEMILGITTDTGDADGKALTPACRQAGPAPLPVPRLCSGQVGEGELKRVRALFLKYTGEIEQIPPMFSAKKINGQPLYKLARQGITVKREPRKVTIYELRITNYDKSIAFYVHCSKGTYIRQLVVDIGDELGTGAHLSALRRIKSGKFTIEEAIDMDTAIQLAGEGKLHDRIQSV